MSCHVIYNIILYYIILYYIILYYIILYYIILYYIILLYEEYWELKEETLDRSQYRTRFGRGNGPTVRQTKGRMYE